MDLLPQLKKLHELRGDTYSSAEVLGLVGRAVAEIEQLRATLLAIVKHGDANGMKNWKVMVMARKALAVEQDVNK